MRSSSPVSSRIGVLCQPMVPSKPIDTVGLPGNVTEITPFGDITSCSAGTVPIAGGGGGGPPGGPGGGGTSISTVPLKEIEVILLTAPSPPSACSYFAKTSATDGSGAAGAMAGFGAGAGPDMTVAGALLGDMPESMFVKFFSASGEKISIALCSLGILSPVSSSVVSALAT